MNDIHLKILENLCAHDSRNPNFVSTTEQEGCACGNCYYGRTELAKLALVAIIALEKLAKLGNGDEWGNSNGNIIAQQALIAVKGVK